MMKVMRQLRMVVCSTWVLILALAVVGCSLTGADKSLDGVPDEETAMEQALLAEQQVARARQTIDAKAKKEEYGKAIAALKKVMVRFPADTRYAPAAHVMIGDLEYELQDYKAAIKTYTEVAAKHREVPDVHAQALFGLGLALEKSEDYAGSKRAYREVIDTYDGSQDPAVRERVAKSRARYRVIH